jgi:polysaccharide biosynthesis/export protein
LRSVQKNPQVTVNIAEYQSQPISVIGAVNKPGIHQLEGRRSLIEVLSAAGGLNNDAGYRIKITRRMEWGAIPLPGAVQDGQFSTAEVSVRELMEARNPEVNIQIKPRDVISIPRARTVYVIGEVEKAGGYVLGEEENMSVLQALSMAGGLTHTAKPQSAKILRSISPSEPRVEEAVDLSKILSGKNKDLPMNANDILFVPNNKPKSVAIRVIEAAVNAGTGVLVFRGSR